MKTVIKILRPVIWKLLRSYWYIFRPTTFGVKIVLTHRDEILFVKHTYGYKYSFPGGGMKSGENREDAIRREVREELGINIGEVHYIDALKSEAEYKKDTIYIFTSELEDKEVKSDSMEIEEAKWFPRDNPPPLGHVTEKMFNLYKASIFE